MYNKRNSEFIYYINQLAVSRPHVSGDSIKAASFTQSHTCRVTQFEQHDLLNNDHSLRKKCSYSDLFWSAFSCIRTEYSIFISPYSVQMRENADQNNFEYGHFSCSDCVELI